MKYILWDFDNTLAYRDGMWSSTIHELLNDYGYNNFKIEDIHPYLKSGFPWHSPEISHKEFFKGQKWWEYIILSNHVPELGELVDNLSIRDYFVKIYSSAHIGYEKPNIKIYKKVLMDLDDVESVTMIGDNYIADIQGAKRAGIDGILVRKSNDYNYDKYFSSLKELANLILREGI